MGKVNQKLKENGFKNYTEYLQTPHWKEKRSQALIWAGERCQICNEASSLEVHHRTYDNYLMIKCRKCHAVWEAVE